MTRLISLMGRRPSLTRVVVAGYVAVVVLCGALGRVDIAVVLTLPVGVLLYPLYAWAVLTGWLLEPLLPAAVVAVITWTLLIGALANAAALCAVGRCLARRAGRAEVPNAGTAPSPSS